MSLSNRIEELLSGYVDNQLSAAELREVQSVLEQPDVQSHLTTLRLLRKSMKALEQRDRPALPMDFADRIMAEAASRKSAIEGQRSVVCPPGNVSTASRSKLIAALVGLAAVLALVALVVLRDGSKVGNTDLAGNGPVNIPPREIVPEVPDFPESMSESSSQQKLVVRQDLQVSYVMTVDLELGVSSSADRVLSALLDKYGIRLVNGVKVDRTIDKALDDMRMTAAPEDSIAGEAYLIRANTVSLGAMLEEIQADMNRFPVVRLGIAYGLPGESLLEQLASSDPKSEESQLPTNGVISMAQAMAKSVSETVTVDEAFAIPLVDEKPADEKSPFASRMSSIPFQGLPVSSSSRNQSLRSPLATPSEEGMSFLLLLVRYR